MCQRMYALHIRYPYFDVSMLLFLFLLLKFIVKCEHVSVHNNKDGNELCKESAITTLIYDGEATI